MSLASDHPLFAHVMHRGNMVQSSVSLLRQGDESAMPYPFFAFYLIFEKNRYDSKYKNSVDSLILGDERRCHSRESGNLWLPIDSGSPFVDGDDRKKLWTPAFAGVTGGVVPAFFSVIPAKAGIQSPLPREV